MQTIKLNLIPGSVLPVVNVSQYDVGRHFALQVYEGATAYDLTGKDVQIRGTKPDGNGFAYDSTDGAISVSTNTVTVTTLQQMTACGGQTMTELRITQSGVILGTLNFILMVEPSALSDDTPISDTDIPAIERDMQDQVDAAEASALEAEGYAVGKQDGVPVGPDSPYYHNNAKWYSDNMQIPDLDDLGNVNITTPTNGQALIYDSVNNEWVNGAGGGGSSTLAGLIDVTLTNPSSGQVLEYDGLKWENASLSIPSNLDDLSDVAIATPSSGEFLKYDGSKWVNGSGGGGGASALNDLSDVTLTTPSAGQALVYDGSKWENNTLNIPAGLDDLSDVTLTTPTSGEVLQYDGTKWENNSLSIPADLDDLSDVQLTTPASGQYLKYDGSKWVNATGGGGGASALDDLTDVDITTPTDGQVLTYDSATQKWVNAAGGGGGGTTDVYGVEWDGSADTTFTRTDDAVGFSDPQPYYAGMSGTPSSSFDNIQPWAGMQKSSNGAAGAVVAIPKFYYKLGYASGTTGLKIQIAPASNGSQWASDNGYSVSPAHIDRGDGSGERDVIYVGRYHCASDYKSKTGVIPKGTTTRATFRSGISALGSSVWQWDFATLITVWMLYLVEFADWQSQGKIGGGCSLADALMNTGYTDTMPYHTGTIASSIGREVYGGTQYRNIEGLWDNVTDFVDGIYYTGPNVYAILDPSNFSDNNNGTLICTRPTSAGVTSAFSMPTVSGYEWAIYPSAVGGSETTHVCDYCDYNANGVVMRVGGNYNRAQGFGMFFINGTNLINAAYDTIGSRLMILP